MRRPVFFLAASAALAACALVHQSASAQDPAAQPPAAQPRRAQAPSDDTLKDVYVMRRVLVREGFASGKTEAHNGLLIHERLAEIAYANGTSYASAGAEAYVVPGQGPTFVLRTSDPVAPGSAAGDVPAEKPKPTVWDEEQDALDGKPREYTVRAASSESYDAAKVDGLRDRLLEQLAKFGSRIRGLSAGDSLTVIVVGGGSALRQQYTAWVPTNGQTMKIETARGAWTVRPGSDANTVLTIRVSVADCQAAATSAIPLDEFRRRATISAY